VLASGLRPPKDFGEVESDGMVTIDCEETGTV